MALSWPCAAARSRCSYLLCGYDQTEKLQTQDKRRTNKQIKWFTFFWGNCTKNPWQTRTTRQNVILRPVPSWAAIANHVAWVLHVLYPFIPNCFFFLYASWWAAAASVSFQTVSLWPLWVHLPKHPPNYATLMNSFLILTWTYQIKMDIFGVTLLRLWYIFIPKVKKWFKKMWLIVR